MHPVVAFDLIYLMAYLACIALLLRGWKKRFNRGTKLLLGGLLFFSLIYSLCLALQWSGVTNKFENIEDFVGALIPMWWAFVFYAFIQEISKSDLVHSEELTKACFNATNEMVYLVDTNGVFLAANNTAAENLGITPEEIVGKKMSDYFSPELTKSRLELGKKVISSGKPLNYQDQRDENFFDVNIFPTFDEKGKIDRLAVFVTDITKNKKFEQQLRQNEERLSLALKGANEGLWDWNLKTGEVYFSPRYYTMLGYEPYEFPSCFQAWVDLVHPEDRENTKTKVLDYAERKSESFAEEFRLRTKSGDYRWILGRGKVAQRDEDGKAVRMIGTHADITDLKKAQEEIESIFNMTGYMICVADLKGNFRRVNKCFEKTLGYTAEELLSRSFLEMIHPDDRDKTITAINEKLNKGKKVTAFENRYRCKDGSYKWLSWTTQPAAEEGIMYAIAYDITRRKKFEAERMRLLKELELKNLELESIIYVSSHDLRTPLINIKGYGYELAKSCSQLKTLIKNAGLKNKKIPELETILDQKIPKELEFISSSISKIDKLQQGILKTCRLGRQQFESKPVNMKNLIADVVKGMKYQFDKSNVAVTIEDLPNCLGDQDTLSQAFSNLLDNAVKYRIPGRKAKVHISGQKKGVDCIYCVEDNGPGIDPAQKEKVFEIFYRISPDEYEQGEGLGLTIVSRIITAQDGKVWLESKPGKGSKFFISLPAFPNITG